MPRPPVVLITGASQGIGAAIAEVFARQLQGAGGCHLALVARNAANLRRVALRCQRLGAVVASPFACDVTDAVAVDALAGAVRKRWRHVDVLIHNAGTYAPDPLLGMAPEQFDAMVAVNLRAAFLIARAFAPAMARRRQGDIFLMASVASVRAFAAGGAYVAAKHGLLGLARALREELKMAGVRVTAVLPGATVSPSWRGSGVPAKRMMPAEDVAQAFFDAWRLSRRTVVEEIILRPQLGDL